MKDYLKPETPFFDVYRKFGIGPLHIFIGQPTGHLADKDPAKNIGGFLIYDENRKHDTAKVKLALFPMRFPAYGLNVYLNSVGFATQNIGLTNLRWRIASKLLTEHDRRYVADCTSIAKTSLRTSATDQEELSFRQKQKGNARPCLLAVTAKDGSDLNRIVQGLAGQHLITAETLPFLAAAQAVMTKTDGVLTRKSVGQALSSQGPTAPNSIVRDDTPPFRVEP